MIFLVFGRLVEDDRGAAHLRAGAGGGRHRDDRRDAVRVGPLPVVADVLEVPDRLGLAGHEGDGLAGVQAAAAAEGDDAVMAAGLEGLDPVLDVLADRVGFDVAEQAGRQAGRASFAATASCTMGRLARPGSVTSSGRVMPSPLAGARPAS